MDWDKILNSAVSTLVGALICGAALIVWQGATSVDDKIEVALAKQKDQNSVIQEQFDALVDQRHYMIRSVELLEDEIIKLNGKINELADANELLREALGKTDFNLPLIPSGKSVDNLPSPKREYFEDNYIQQQLAPLEAIPEPQLEK
jgi:hypothetical protein